MDPANPIPDFALKEDWPVGFKAWSLWERIVRKVNWGHRASFRRAWVDATATADGEPVFIGSVIDSWHCSADANLLLDAAKPSMEILAQYSDLGVEIIDDSSSGARLFRWARAGLEFEIRALAVGKHLYEILAVSRGEPPKSAQLDDHFARARRNLQSPNESQRHNCTHTLWRFLFALILIIAIPGIPALIVVAVIGTALGLGSLTGLLLFWVFIGGCYATSLWFTRRNREYLNEHWRRVFHQGDHDGTVRRALASIGIDLPIANTPE